MRRHEDWLKQAHSDLNAAEDSAGSSHFEWACFQAQQAAAKDLDKNYIPTRYPASFSTGIPKDFFTSDDARRAIANAKKIIGFAEENLK